MDKLLRGFICDKAVSFFAISAKDLVQHAVNTHDCSKTASAALGRSLMLCTMMGYMLKDEGDVSLIIKGGGPSGSIVCVAKNTGIVKGYVTNPDIDVPPKASGKLDVGAFVGNSGMMTIVRNMGLKEPYIGQSHLVSGEIAEDAAAYFTYSQQQPSLVHLGVHVDKNKQVISAGGIIIQPLPYCSDEIITSIENKIENIERMTTLLQDMDIEEVILQIFGELDTEISEHKMPMYECDCNRYRLESVLLSLGREELEDMIATDGKAQLSCHFCNKLYDFSQEELVALIAAGSEEIK